MNSGFINSFHTSQEFTSLAFLEFLENSISLQFVPYAKVCILGLKVLYSFYELISL